MYAIKLKGGTKQKENKVVRMRGRPQKSVNLMERLTLGMSYNLIRSIIFKIPFFNCSERLFQKRVYYHCTS